MAALTHEVEESPALAIVEQRDLLRVITAGSVDDGKSTLIGRLLYDSQTVYEDHIAAVRRASKRTQSSELDLSLLTDGLRAEREQGITIDVAHRYFATARRKFILADTPGHEQYTRNMATAASTASAAILLIDARHGVLPQSRRHACIAALLGVGHCIVAINKMDLVGYDAGVFYSIQAEMNRVLTALGVRHRYFIPVSALNGDNVVRPSQQMPWYAGKTLLACLETIDVQASNAQEPFYMAVQRVARPNHTFRGYSGQIGSGTIRRGDAVMVLPAGVPTTVKSIVTFDGELESAQFPMSITLTLEDQIDISRGDVVCAVHKTPDVASSLDATLVWFHADPLNLSRRYLVKHTTQTTTASITSLEYGLDIHTLSPRPRETLQMNEIGRVHLNTARPLVFHAYDQHRVGGGIIVIDADTNATVAAGMIHGRAHAIPGAPRGSHQPSRSPAAALEHLAVTATERIHRYGHRGTVVNLQGRRRVGLLLERRLFDIRAAVVLLDEAGQSVTEALKNAGFIVLVVDGAQRDVEVRHLPVDDSSAAEMLYRQLMAAGVLMKID